MYAQEHNKVNVTSAANLSNRFTPPAYQIFLCLVKLLLKRKANALGNAFVYVRCTTEADGVCPCTMYDVRCTIAMFGAGGAGESEEGAFLIRMSDDISQ